MTEAIEAFIADLEQSRDLDDQILYKFTKGMANRIKWGHIHKKGSEQLTNEQNELIKI